MVAVLFGWGDSMEKRRTIESEELRGIIDDNSEQEIVKAWNFYLKYVKTGIDIDRKAAWVDARNKIVLKKMEFIEQAFEAAKKLDLGINALKEGDE